ncbi:MAG: hypothetical protein M0Z45_00935 [Actinomycetota bacterium]|nr:hypothetical protein [Actinomycetota bacterium]
MDAKNHKNNPSTKFLAKSLSIAMLYLELLIPLFPSILFISRPRWEELSQRIKIDKTKKTATHIALEFIDASRFYLYIDSIYLCTLLISFAIYLLAPVHNSPSIITSIKDNFSNHQTKNGVIEIIAELIVVVASALRIIFYIVSIIDTAINGRLKLWRITKLPPKNQTKVSIGTLDHERPPLHLAKKARRPWFTFTALSIVLTTVVVSLAELYIQGGSLTGKIIGDSQSSINFNLLMLWWWPHQLLALHNPISATYMAAKGLNLSLSPNSEFLAILFSPITLKYGPKVSMVIIQLLLPVVGGVGTYRFCRILGTTRMGSLASGLLFEVTAVVPSALSGHLDAAMIAIFPVAAGEVIAYLQGRLSPRRTVLGATFFLLITLLSSIGLGLLALLFISTVASTAALAYGRIAVQRLRRIGARCGVGVIVAIVFDAPNLYYAIAKHSKLEVSNTFDLKSALLSSTGHLLAIPDAKIATSVQFLDPLMVVASIFLVSVNLLNRRSRAGVIAATLTVASLVLIVGPSFTLGSDIWPGTLLLGHTIAPLPLTIPNSLPGLNLVSQEMLTEIFFLFTSILVGLFASHSFASSKSEHFIVNYGLNYATVVATAFGIVSAIPISGIGEVASIKDTSLSAIGSTSKLANCLRGTKTLLELPPDGNHFAIEAMRLTGEVLPTIGSSLGYNVTYASSTLESILNYSTHSKVAYLPIFEHEINSSRINSVIVTLNSEEPWIRYISALGSSYHLACTAHTVSISRR